MLRWLERTPTALCDRSSRRDWLPPRRRILVRFEASSMVASAPTCSSRAARTASGCCALDRQRRGQERQFEAAMDASYGRAHPLLASRGAVHALDPSRESLAVLERDGLSTHGQAVLQARRLVGAGVPQVRLFWKNDGIIHVGVYGDTPSRNFIDLKALLGPLGDQGRSAHCRRTSNSAGC
jgi:hypothetical protein